MWNTAVVMGRKHKGPFLTKIQHGEEGASILSAATSSFRDSHHWRDRDTWGPNGAITGFHVVDS